MSTVYTPAAVALGNITIPADGDPRTAASVNGPIQAIADGVKYAQKNAIVATGYTRLATTFSTVSTTYVDVTGLSRAMTCVAGDVLIIDAKIVMAGSSTFDFVRLLITDGGGDIDPNEFAVTVQTGADHLPLSFTYTVVNTGTVTVRAQAKVTSGTGTVYGDSTANAGSSSIRILQSRP